MSVIGDASGNSVIISADARALILQRDQEKHFIAAYENDPGNSELERIDFAECLRYHKKKAGRN